jgi:photosystem II stability/assembly factor-like uncharacterized protein
MKTLISLLAAIFLLPSIAISQGVWQIIDSPINDNLVSVCFVDEDHGWIASDQGNILITEDGGDSWMMGNIEGIPESIHFTDTEHGCIVGRNTNAVDSTFIMMTTDGGFNWISKSHPNAVNLYDVFFIDNDIGWAVGIKNPVGWILYTSDGGNIWNRQMMTMGVSAYLKGVHFRDEVNGNICGEYGTFLSTNNGGVIGNGWAINISTPTLGKDFYGIQNFNDLQGCVVGADGLVIYTIDGWYNWIEMVSGVTDTLWAVSNAPGSNHVWAVGNNGTIIHNEVYLFPWDQQVSHTTENLNDVCMINADEGWAVGDNGTIRKYEMGLSVENRNPINEMTLFPNPVNDILHLSFNENHTIDKIQLRSITGIMIWETDIHFQSELVFNCENLSPGIYFIKVFGNSSSIIKKIVKK